MKNKKLALVIAAVLTALICSVITAGFSCPFFSQMNGGYVASLLKSSWDVDLPENAKVLYYVENTGFSGDGDRYYVLKYEEEPTELLENFKFERDDAFENSFRDWFGSCIDTAENEVPEKYKPDLSKEYFWVYMTKEIISDKLYLLYYPETLTLYVLMYHV